MIVNVEPRPEMFLDDAATADIAKTLSGHIKSLIGISTKVRVLEPNTIPRSMGKAKRVVDNRPKP